MWDRKQHNGESKGHVPSPTDLFRSDISSEPKAQSKSTPAFFICLLFLLSLWGELYVMGRGGDVTNSKESGGPFPGLVFEPYQTYEQVRDAQPPPPVIICDPNDHAEWVRLGRQVYNLACNACHQANGEGIPGMFPPLAGSEWVLTENPGRAIRAVLNGLAGKMEVRGKTYENTMPPWRDTLSDEQIAQVVSYIRNAWSNKGSIVKAEQVQEWRTKDGGRGELMNVQDLLATPDK